MTTMTTERSSPELKQFDAELRMLESRRAEPFEVLRHFMVSDDHLERLGDAGRMMMYARRNGLKCADCEYLS